MLTKATLYSAMEDMMEKMLGFPSALGGYSNKIDTEMNAMENKSNGGGYGGGYHGGFGGGYPGGYGGGYGGIPG